MLDLQTIDLRDAPADTASVQQRVLDRIAAISASNGSNAWTDGPELQLLLMRYEEATLELAAAWRRSA